MLALQALHHAIDVERELGGVFARRVGTEANVEIAVARGHGDAVADLAQFLELAIAPVQDSAQQRYERTQPDQDSDQHVVIGTRHVLRPGGAKNSPDPMFSVPVQRAIAGRAQRRLLLFRFAAEA